MVFISFLLFTVFVGIVTYFKTKDSNLSTSDGYFLGGRSLTGGVIAGSLLLTNLSAVNFVGMSAQAYTDNMSVMGWEVGSGITLVIVALFLIPRYLKQGISTIPQFIETRFDVGTRKFITFLFMFGFVVNTLPIVLYSGAVAMSQIFDIESIFGISYVQSIWLTVWAIGILGSIYALAGGLRAVAISDTVNGIVLIFGGLLVPICALAVLGDGSISQGFDNFLNATPEKFNSVGKETDPLPFSTLFTGVILLNFFYWGCSQEITQRGLGAKNLVEAQKGIIFAGFLKVLTPFMVIIPGIMAYQIFGELDISADLIYPKLVNAVLPTSLVGIFAAAMLGAILSTFNSVLNSASTIFALNIYKPSFGEGKPETQLVKVGKIFGIIVAIISMIVAPLIMYAPSGLFQYLQTINGLFNVPIFAIIFMGYLTKRVPPIAAKVAITFFVLVYGSTQLIWDTGMHFLHISAILFVISCIIMLVIGKLKPMDHDFELPNNKLVNIEPWKYRFRAGSFVIFVMIAMYILFSPLGISQEGGIGLNTVISLIVAAIICTILSVFLDKNAKKGVENND